MKKRFSALFLSLVLCIGLAVPTFAAPAGETAPTAITMGISNPDGSAPQTGSMEFTLRNITEEYFPDNRLSAIHTDFTRNEETETVTLDDVSTLTPGGAIQIDGIQTLSDTQKPWNGVYLSAWSDPDGDGVYDQQLFYFYWDWNWDWDESSRDTAIAFTVPLSQTGPFSCREINYNEGMPIYSRSINVLSGDGKFSHRPYSYSTVGAVVIPSSITLDGNDLTGLLGPNTLVRIQATTAEKLESTSAADEESPAFYAYIPADAVAIPEFTDLPDWCAKEAQWAAARGIAQGTGGSKFSPGSSCTHEQILTFLYRAVRGEGPAASEDMALAVAWAREEGIIDDSFNPKAPCTRADAVTYIWRAMGSHKAAAGSSFTDISADADCAAAVAWAVEKEIINGFANGDGTFRFRPDQVCRRGEIACFLYRAYRAG